LTDGLIGTHTYDILANPIYARKFQYFSNDIKDRNHYIIDGDDQEENDGMQCNFIRLILHTGYLHKDETLRQSLTSHKLRYALSLALEDKEEALSAE
jgi:hypothetical protein